MKKIFLLSLITIMIFSCKKQVEKQEKLFVRGRLFLTDTLTQNSISVPLGNKIVQLAENKGDSLNFLYSNSTDNDGYFVFNLLNSYENNTGFVVRFKEKIGNYWYNAADTVVKGQDNIVLQAQLSQAKQNGFFVYIKDSLGGGIPTAKIHIYNSLVLATINNPAGAVDSITANATGKAFKMNIPPGNYYLNTKKVVDTFVFERRMRQISIPAEGIILLNPDSIRVLRTR